MIKESNYTALDFQLHILDGNGKTYVIELLLIFAIYTKIKVFLWHKPSDCDF